MPRTDKPAINIPARVNIASSLFFIALSLIIFRLVYMQILYGEYFRLRSENNRLRTVYLPAPRGLIFDRNHELLVKNRPSFDVELVQEDTPDPKATVRKLAEVVNMDPDTLLQGLRQQRRRRFESKLIIKDVSRDLMAKIVARRHELPGIVIKVVPTREYPHGDLAAHVLGYIREINKTQLENPNFSGYRLGDLAGQYGVEARWESFLHGLAGIQDVVVNATGARIDNGRLIPEIAGNSITLTLDVDVQRAADGGFKDKAGALIAIHADTGEILALSSAPRFDPNLFTHEIPIDVWKDIVAGPGKKLNNRVAQGVYPPGSVFKMVVASAALAQGVINPSDRIHCPGSYQLGRASFACHKKTGHGAVNLEEALIQSCDVYFYTVGQRLGVDLIHEYADKFGLGRTSGFDLVDEASGLVPSTEWKRRYFKNPEMKKWYPGETPSVAIGQGAVTTTPLQLARAMAALVNGGRLITPHLIRKIESLDGNFSDDDFTDLKVEKVDIDPKILERVTQGLIGVVSDPRGTGHRAQLPKEFGISVGGKTGTAQAAGDKVAAIKRLGDHAWFVGFAPAEKPEIVVAALVEHGGHGGVAAAPIVEQVMQAYFSKVRGIQPARGVVNGIPSVVSAQPAEQGAVGAD